jgi:hypothetical protein
MIAGGLAGAANELFNGVNQVQVKVWTSPDGQAGYYVDGQTPEKGKAILRTWAGVDRD